MKWIREHIRLISIMSVVLILLIGMIVSYTASGNMAALSKVTAGGLTAVQGPVTNLGNRIAGGISSLFSFVTIKKENTELKTEVSELNRKIISLQLDKAELEELRTLKSALNYQGLAVGYDYVTADVAALDDSDQFNIFTINAGSDQGIAVDSVVLDGDGLVGHVYSVGGNWAKVISVIDENNSVSFRVFRDVSLLGILSGDGKGGLNGYMLNSNASVIEGDLLITSGLGFYPAGVPIGKVTKIEWQNDQLIKAVTIDPSVNFKDIQKVVVATPQASAEQVPLE